MRTHVPRATGLLDGLLELVAPHRCLSCGSRSAPPWCPTCALLLTPIRAPCRRCAGATAPTHACWPADAPVDAVVAPFDYRGVVTDAIVTAKLRGAHAGWSSLAAPLVDAVAAAAPPVDLVTWITTPRTRVRLRGRDHGRELASHVAAGLGFPCRRLLDAREGPRGDRYQGRATLGGRSLLLVDDVLTTGTTAWRAAAVLRGAGAGHICLAVLARAGSHPLGRRS